MTRLSITAIIPARDAAATITPALQGLAPFFAAGHEIIVVDDGSRDSTAQIAETQQCRVIRHEQSRGPAAARNAGATAATGDVLLFIDADVVTPSNLLPRLTEMFAQPETGAAQGLYEPSLPQDTPVTAYQNDYYHWTFRRAAGPRTAICATFCFAVRRELFQQLGGFEERITDPTVEDEEFGYRLFAAGCPIWLATELQVRHLAVYTLWSFVRRRFRMSRNQMRSLLRQRYRAPAQQAVGAGENVSHHPLTMLLGIPLVCAGCAGLALAALGLPAAAVAGGLSWGLALALNFPLVRFLGRGGLKRMVFSAGMLLLDWAVLAGGLAAGAWDKVIRRKY